MRGVSAIDTLVKEHNLVKSLLQRLRSSDAVAERQQVLKQVQHLLTIHNATEENLIYPAINKIAGHKLEPIKLYNETAQAEMMLFELDTMMKTGDLEDLDKKVGRFCDAICQHIDEEESSAFRHLRDGADPREMQLLNESFLRFRESTFGSAGERVTTGTT